MTITPEREKVVDFVGPYYHAGRAVFVNDASAVQKLDELKGKTLGVTLGETHEKWAREQGGWDVRTYKGLPELLLELKSGRVDAIVVDNIPVMVAVKETGEKVRRLETPDIEGGSVAIGIAIRKNNPELKAAMQKALDRDDGGWFLREDRHGMGRQRHPLIDRQFNAYGRLGISRPYAVRRPFPEFCHGFPADAARLPVLCGSRLGHRADIGSVAAARPCCRSRHCVGEDVGLAGLAHIRTVLCQRVSRHTMPDPTVRASAARRSASILIRLPQV